MTKESRLVKIFLKLLGLFHFDKQNIKHMSISGIHYLTLLAQHLEFESMTHRLGLA